MSEPPYVGCCSSGVQGADFSGKPNYFQRILEGEVAASCRPALRPQIEDTHPFSLEFFPGRTFFEHFSAPLSKKTKLFD
jgi:hypothetical protein